MEGCCQGECRQSEKRAYQALYRTREPPKPRSRSRIVATRQNPADGLTDWPAAAYHSTYKPLDAIEIALTRQELGNAGAAILPPVDERIGLAQALEANTLGSAYMLRREKDIGSIESGKLADMVVLQENLFKVAPNEIARVPVVMTMMNGCFTHET